MCISHIVHLFDLAVELQIYRANHAGLLTAVYQEVPNRMTL
jgi:hypothetical protein